MSRSARLVAAVLALPLLVVACGGDDDDGGGAAAEPGVVSADDNVFEPKEITVGEGETVTWRFVGGNAHNVVFDDFKSDLMKEGEFEHTFEEAGSFDYVCTVHPRMEGTVVVEEAASGG